MTRAAAAILRYIAERGGVAPHDGHGSPWHFLLDLGYDPAEIQDGEAWLLEHALIDFDGKHLRLGGAT